MIKHSDSEKRHYLDNIRWSTVILVVLFHTIYIYNGEASTGVIGPFSSSPQYQDVVQYLLYPWFMMLLFIVSGVCSRLSLEHKTEKEFLKSRTRKLLVPSTIGLVVFQWIQGYVNMLLSGAFEKIPDTVPKPVLFLIMCVSGTGVLWYIQMLWVFSLVLVVIRKSIDKQDKLFSVTAAMRPWMMLLLCIPVYLAAQVLNTPVIVCYHFGSYGICFFIGFYVFAHDELVEKLSNCWKYLVPASILSGAVFTIKYFGENYADKPVINSPLCVLFAWLTCLAVFATMKRFGNRRNEFTDFMSRKSFGLYVFHYLPLSSCAYALNRYCSSLPPFLCYVSVSVSAFAGGYGLFEIVSRIPFLRWCVLGL